MRFYGDAPGASMLMQADPTLIGIVQAFAVNIPLKVVIETGTFQGTGSTKFLCEALAASRPPEVFHTIEVNYESAMKARENLKQFPFVKSYWGCSVDIAEALIWLRDDDFLERTDEFPDVWTDHMKDAKKHYADEVRGSSLWAYEKDGWAGYDLLRKFAVQHRDDFPLFVLDSAGGIGWFEFMVMKVYMGDRPYVVLLDDVHHVKHYRSLKYMEDPANGFVISKVQGKWAIVSHIGPSAELERLTTSV